MIIEMNNDKISVLARELEKRQNYKEIESFLIRTIRKYFPESKIVDEILPLRRNDNSMIGMKIMISPEFPLEYFEIVIKPDHNIKDRELRLIIVYKSEIMQEVIDLDNHFISTKKLFEKEIKKAEELINYHFNLMRIERDKKKKLN